MMVGFASLAELLSSAGAVLDRDGSCPSAISGVTNHDLEPMPAIKELTLVRG